MLSAIAACVYGFITYSLVRGGERARRAALVCCAAELLFVLIVGTWTLADASAFPDATVWSDYGMGYLFIPVILPVAGHAVAAGGPSAEGRCRAPRGVEAGDRRRRHRSTGSASAEQLLRARDELLRRRFFSRVIRESRALTGSVPTVA